MKIGFTTSVIQRGKTGIAEYVFSLLRAIADQGTEHQFVLFTLERDLPLFKFARGNMELAPVSESFRPPVRDVFWHQTVLPRLARIYRLDLVHVPSYRRMMWHAPCPKVATVHDLAAFHIPGKYDWKRMFYARVVAAHLAGRQEALISVSERTAQDMARFWKIPRWRVGVIHHGMDLQRFSVNDIPGSHAFCSHRFGLRQPFFLYVSRLEHPGKNHVRLIKAFELFKQQTNSTWELALVGSNWHGAETIHAAISRSPFREDIRCLGFVSKRDLPGLYRAAGVMVYPSLYEGFGLPVLEAMASGCPVLCSTRGALGEVIGNAAATADPEDPEDFGNQMARLVGTESLRSSLSAAGLAWSKQFDWAQAARQTLAVYTNTLARPECHRTPEPVSSRASGMVHGALPISFSSNRSAIRHPRRATFFDTSLGL